MDSLSIESIWAYLAPFVQLPYPTDTPAKTDSFYDARHYNTGRLDLLYIVGSIAFMAILRDVLRLWVFEPLAQWKLMRDLNRKYRNLAIKANGSASSPANGKALNGNGRATNGNGHALNGNGHAANGNGHALNGNGYSNGSAAPSKPTTKELRQVHRSVLRFAEQGWSVVYCTFIWSYGLYLHINLPTKIFEPSALWMDYPHIPLSEPVKFYYLTQTAFYLHQVLILNAEARRKDHIQMMIHHVITVGLLFLSYFTNFTRVGCTILLLMDWCDIFLPLAKMMRYIAISQLATDMTFGFFLISWLVTRHFLFIFIVTSTLRDMPKHVPYLVDPERGYYLTKPAYLAFCIMLLALEVLQCIWFWMICRVAWRVVMGSGASDDRSDEEIDDSDGKNSKKDN